MLRVINCLQHSPEWYQARLGNATASCFDKVITSTGARSKQLDKYAKHLASELLVKEQDPFFYNSFMERGNELEDEARAAYQVHTFEPVEQVGFVLIDDKDYGYSPDGLVGKDGQIEIKCPSQAVHTEYLYNDELPSDYKAQVQGGLLVTGRDWCDFVSYHPNFLPDQKLFVKRVYRDEDFISRLEMFLAEVIKLRVEILAKIKNKKG